MKKFWYALLALYLVAGCNSGGRRPEKSEAPSATVSPALRAELADLSSHQTHLVEVELGVHLEVLDWGGGGEPMVLLAGLGDNAHVYDDFANQFTDRFRVLAITRRGFGRSSQPETGYDVATRTLDDIRVLDSLKIKKAVFVGHSFAGDELSKLGAEFPDRVDKLIYLDAVDYGDYAKLVQPPLPEYGEDDISSVAKFTALKVRYFGSRLPLPSLAGQYRFDESGKLVGVVSSPEISKKLTASSKRAEYGRIKAPVLAIFATLIPDPPQPFYEYLTPDQKVEYDRTFPAVIAWQAEAMERLRKGVKGARVIELPGAYHYIYINNEAFVVSQMREFLFKDSKEARH